jgi:hypothetical protein
LAIAEAESGTVLGVQLVGTAQLYVPAAVWFQVEVCADATAPAARTAAAAKRAGLREIRSIRSPDW